jgi:predicted RNA binding protein YcfA (HicA-like mRNA interferase family)
MQKGAVQVTIPNHMTIAPKTLQSILRQAGITVEDFIEQL